MWHEILAFSIVLILVLSSIAFVVLRYYYRVATGVPLDKVTPSTSNLIVRSVPLIVMGIVSCIYAHIILYKYFFKSFQLLMHSIDSHLRTTR